MSDRSYRPGKADRGGTPRPLFAAMQKDLRKPLPDWFLKQEAEKLKLRKAQHTPDPAR